MTSAGGTAGAVVADVGVIGGSGFYSFLTATEEWEVDTPFGPPSDPVVVGEVDGRRVAFLPRHGRDHRFPPHRVPYRANLWALRALGVRQVLTPCAVGSLDPAVGPGSLVVPDQLVDRTSGRAQTVFDGPHAVHVSFADPYDETGRQAVLAEARAQGWEPAPVDGGALVVVEGPRFSTRAESRWYAAQGWRVIGMTGHPEAALARELEMACTTACLVTDLDVGADDGSVPPVSHAEVLAVFGRSLDRLRALLLGVLPQLPTTDALLAGGSPALRALEGIRHDLAERLAATPVRQRA